MKMNIRPITPLANVNNYTNLTFDGKKKKNVNQNLNITRPSSHKLAVPLAATVLAMSPMSSASAKTPLSDVAENKVELCENPGFLNLGPKVIKSKIFTQSRKSAGGVPYDVQYRVNLISNDLDNDNFEKIQIVVKEPGISDKPAVYNVSKLSTYNFSIVSDDGSESNSFSLDEVTTHNTKYDDDAYGNESHNTEKIVCDFIKAELNSSRNNSKIERKVIARKIRPSMFYNLQNGKSENNMNEAVPISRPDYRCLGFQDFKGLNGNYKFGYYSTSDEDKIEFVTIQKDGGPELAVRKNIIAKGIFNAGSSQPFILNYGITEVYDNNQKKYYISDQALSNALVMVYNDDMTAGYAFGCEAKEEEYLYPFGMILSMTTDEEE